MEVAKYMLIPILHQDVINILGQYVQPKLSLKKKIIKAHIFWPANHHIAQNKTEITFSHSDERP